MEAATEANVYSTPWFTRNTNTITLDPNMPQMTNDLSPSTTLCNDETDTTVPPLQQKFWKILSDDSLEPHRFLSLTKDIFSHDDSLQPIKHFYQKICPTIHSSFKHHVDFLPAYEKKGYTTIHSIYYLYCLVRAKNTRVWHPFFLHGMIPHRWDTRGYFFSQVSFLV